MAANRCIGRDNRMPWHLPADLRHFKQVTLGHPVIMGRKTFETILVTLGKPLPGRTSIIVSRDLNYRIPDLPPGARQSLLLADSPITALEAATAIGAATVFVIGGAEIYRAMLPAVSRMMVTEIKQNFDGDAFFPPIEPHIWREVSRLPQDRGGDPEVDFDFVDYARRM